MSNLDLKIVGRNNSIFNGDIVANEIFLQKEISENRFLVIGGAGTIGQAVCKEIFKRNPASLHVVDISENNLVELVRDIRSSYENNHIDFKIFSLDCASLEFERMINKCGPYDYVLNLSALKHVRSEQDPFTLMRMIQVNILNTISTIDMAIKMNAKKYFCVSTDKAANPVNLMGASKRIMELFLNSYNENINISSARFANVIFSDGSLLHSFNQRLIKNQPLVAPRDIKRYFVTPQESGELCLLSCLMGNKGDIFFPKLVDSMDLKSFADLASIYLKDRGFDVHECKSENEARSCINQATNQGKWPCLFTESDTTGEKPYEEFYTENEKPDFKSFLGIGVVKNLYEGDQQSLNNFLEELKNIRKLDWNKVDVVNLFNKILPNFNHNELNKSLNEKM